MTLPDRNLAESAAAIFQHGFGGVLRIEPEDAGRFDVDGRGDRCLVVDPAGNVTPDCVWRADAETLGRIFEGGRALESAFLSGRLSIAGDMSVMARVVMEGAR